MTVHNFTSDQFNVEYPRPGSSSPNGTSKSTLKEKAFKCSKCPKRYTQKESIFTEPYSIARNQAVGENVRVKV